MTDLDLLLEECMKDLDRGVPLEKVIRCLPSEAQELVPLLRMVVITRSISHPGMPSAKAKEQRKTLVQYAHSFADPGHKFSLQIAWIPIVLVMALLLLASIVTVALAGPPGNRYATLTNVMGIVEISPDTQGKEWFPVETGQRVRAGQLVRTRIDSQATLVFFEGTQTALSEETEVALQIIRGGWNQSLRVEMRQEIGHTSHNVIPLSGANSHYIVQTKTGRAAVRGTLFEVLVKAGGASRFLVTRGSIEVTSAQERVRLAAGQSILTSMNLALHR
jgi:hypothetical protein